MSELNRKAKDALHEVVRQYRKGHINIISFEWMTDEEIEKADALFTWIEWNTDKAFKALEQAMQQESQE